MNHRDKVATFERVRRNYRDFLEGVLWKLTGERELFDEAYQNAMLALWQHIEKLDHDQPGGYIYRIALSSARTAWRARVGRNMEFSAERIAAAGTNPQENLLKKEAWDILRQAVTELSEQQGRAVVMRYLETKEYQQVAQELNCSEAAARTHVSNAIAALKKKMSRFLAKEPSHG